MNPAGPGRRNDEQARRSRPPRRLRRRRPYCVVPPELGHLLLVLVLLLLPPGHISVVILGTAGLLATFLAVVNLQATDEDGRSTSVEAHWTGAPMVAIFLWLALITTAAIANKTLSD